MKSLTPKDKELLLKLNIEGLTATQIRLIKNIHALLTNVLACEEEEEFFETSAGLFKKTAELIKYSQFSVQHKNISYGDQAIEFALDNLTEEFNKTIQNVDN